MRGDVAEELDREANTIASKAIGIAVTSTGFLVACGDGEALACTDWHGPTPRLHQILENGA